MAGVDELYRAASVALPPGWHLNGLRCASTGLGEAQRSDRWVAEACGPVGACEVIERDLPADALRELARLVGERRRA
jgi:hypothetical protein